MTNVELFLQNATLEADNKNLVQQASGFQDRLRSLEHQNNKLQSQISSNQVLLQWGKFSQHNIKKKEIFSLLVQASFLIPMLPIFSGPK